jgi:thioredoxin reductase (NADPH)
VRQTIIIGPGPAGYTAESYAGRACLNPLVIASSVEAGGELVTNTEVEKFPGFRTASRALTSWSKSRPQPKGLPPRSF